MFDRAGLTPWNIPRELLIPRIIALAYDHKLWDQPRWSIIGVIGLCIGEALWIVVLLLNHVRGIRSERLLQQRYTLENQILDLSTKIVSLPTAELAEGVREQIGRIMDALEIDVILLLEVSQIGEAPRICYEWQREELRSERSDCSLADLPWVANRILQDEKVVVENTASMPPGAESERRHFLERDIQSCIGIPLKKDTIVLGGLICFKLHTPRAWSHDVIQPLEIIAGIFLGALERKMAEEALRESESRFREMADTAPFMIWTSGPDKLRAYLNKPWLDFTGRSLEQDSGVGWTEEVHADDLERCLETYWKAFDTKQSFKMEYRRRRFDGEYRWLLDVGAPRFNANGTLLGYIGSCIDINEWKRTEDTLLNLSGRLITAQEEERFRIARELHDDLSQRMALFLIQLDQVRQRYPNMPEGAMTQLAQIAQIADEVSSDIHDLSHRLHPSRLYHLGLVAAVGRLCREFSDQYELHIEFIHHNVPKSISKDLSLCLYRVSQEALSNVAKHSGAGRASVVLSGSAGRIDLYVSDPGEGFDFKSAEEKGGLGLLSMRERLRAVGGELSVRSQRPHGTNIWARVPLPEPGLQVQQHPPPLRDEESKHLPISGRPQ